MFSDYKRLLANGIELFSVKTDAFTIKSTDLEHANACIKVGNVNGSWRCSKDENMNFPFDFFVYI